MSPRMAQDSTNISGFLVQYHNTQRVQSFRAQGYKHELEAFKRKLSMASLFHTSSTRILYCSLELALVNYTCRLNVLVFQPGWFTCVCFWIKVLKSPPCFRFEGCVVCCLTWSSLLSCFQTIFTCESQVPTGFYPFLAASLGQKEFSPGDADLFFRGCWGNPKNQGRPDM